MSNPTPGAMPARCTLYFDGGCPVCAREIALYQRQAGAEAIDWIDVSACGPGALGPELTRDDALRRLHLRQPDGTLVSGAAAFVALWAALPRWAWLARLCGSRPALRVLEAAYRTFLVVRRGWRRAG